jgi:hypothetical protein
MRLLFNPGYVQTTDPNDPSRSAGPSRLQCWEPTPTVGSTSLRFGCVPARLVALYFKRKSARIAVNYVTNQHIGAAIPLPAEPGSPLAA